MGFQIEINARMDAALAEMPIQVASIVKFIQQLAKIAQICADLIRRHGSIFPAFPRNLFIGHVRGGPQAGFAHFQIICSSSRLSNNFIEGGLLVCFKAFMQAVRLRIRFGFIPAAKFRE